MLKTFVDYARDGFAFYAEAARIREELVALQAEFACVLLSLFNVPPEQVYGLVSNGKMLQYDGTNMSPLVKEAPHSLRVTFFYYVDEINDLKVRYSFFNNAGNWLMSQLTTKNPRPLPEWYQ